MPKVSVIVPNYNHARFLVQRLDSIFNQTFQDFEVILLDDCSADNSVEVLKEYAKHPKVSHFIINDKNSGSTFKQWEKGIDLAKGEYIWIAESDDFAEPDFLLELTRVFENNKNVVLAFCKSNWINDKNEVGPDLSVYNESFTRTGTDEIRHKLIYGNTIQNASSVLFRSNALKCVSPRYTKYFSCGDWLLYTELLSKGDLYYSEKVLNNFRWYHNNVSNNSAKQGLWIYEGIDVINLSKRIIKYSKAEKIKLIQSWLEKTHPLRVSIPFSLKKYFSINLKLFIFAPIVYFKIILFGK